MSGIFRVRRYKPGEFFQALKAPFQDEELSFGARGILAYLLTHGDGWEVRNKDLYDKSPAGRAAVDRMVKELKDAGYLHRYQVSRGKGVIDWVTDVYENREDNPEYQGGEGGQGSHYTKAGFTDVEKSAFDNTNVENSTLESSTVEKPSDIVIKTSSNIEPSNIKTDSGVPPALDALQIYESVFEFSVPKNMRRDVLQKVGGDLDALRLWKDTCVTWKYRGYGPKNFENLFDRFDKGGFDEPATVTGSERTTNGKAAGTGNRDRKAKTGNKAGRSAPGLSRADIRQRAHLATIGGIIGGSD